MMGESRSTWGRGRWLWRGRWWRGWSPPSGHLGSSQTWSSARPEKKHFMIKSNELPLSNYLATKVHSFSNEDCYWYILRPESGSWLRHAPGVCFCSLWGNSCRRCRCCHTHTWWSRRRGSRAPLPWSPVHQAHLVAISEVRWLLDSSDPEDINGPDSNCTLSTVL